MKDQTEIKNLEIKKIPYMFFSELSSLLYLNQTDSMTISGISYNYIISRSGDSIVSIEKRNIDSFYTLEFDIKKQEIEYFDFRDDSNTHSIDDYNNGLFFIYEFYNLFIQRKLSTVVTNLYNFLTKKKTDHLYFSTTDNNIFFKAEKPGNHLLVLLKIDRYENIIEKIAVRKIDQIPFWFLISKTSDYTCIRKVKRLITFYSGKQDNHFLLNNIDLYNTNHDFTEYNPYFDTSEKTSAEEMIADFEEKYMNNYLKMPEPIPEEYCPLCGKIMNLKTGVYGPFFGCSDYPRCKGSLSINIVKKENS